MGDHKVQRGLQNRHLQMIALGGAIGTGLFLGSAAAIQEAGPAIAVSYFIGGVLVYFLMRMLAEMCVHEPVFGSFSYFANRYWHRSAGFVAGWSYYMLYVLVSMAELTAVGIYINFWFPEFPTWLSALITLVVITSVNLIHVRWFGEVESAMSVIKVAAVIAMILLGSFLLYTRHLPVTDTFSYLWIYDGFMPHGISGIAASLPVVMFSFVGIELIGMTAAEVEEPEKNIPVAVNQVIYRVMIFYVGAMIVLLSLFPWNKIGLNGSPFVMIFDQLGIPAAAHILNLVVLSAAVSVYNSAMYSNARMLYAMSKAGNAPKFLSAVAPNGTPVMGILATAFLTLSTVMANYLIPNEVFDNIITLSVSCIIISWFCIIMAHMKFREHHKKEATVDTIKYKSMLYPVANYIAIAFLLYVSYSMFISGGSMQLAIILIPIWLGILYVGYMMSRSSREKAEAQNQFMQS